MKMRAAFAAAFLAVNMRVANGAVVTDASAVFTEPVVPKPAYLTSFTDLTFNTTVTRIADDSGRSLTTLNVGNGTWGTDSRHEYSLIQPWNADGSLMVIENNSAPGHLYLDGSTYQVKYGDPSNLPVGNYEYRWHPSLAHKNELVVFGGSTLEWFDLVNNAVTRSWTLPIGITASGKQETSLDGRFIALFDPTGTKMFVVDMDPQAPYSPYPSQRIGPVYDLSADGISYTVLSDGYVTISPSGKYVVVHYDGYDTYDHARVFDVDPNTLALTPRALPANSPRCVGTAAQGFIWDLGHPDVAVNPYDNNEDVLVGQEECGRVGQSVAGITNVPGASGIGHVIMVRLRDGAGTSLTDPANEGWAWHISTRNTKRPGWAYVSYDPSQPSTRFNDETIALSMDGRQTVERLVHHHTNPGTIYRAQPHSVPSPDGLRIAFASNWGLNCGSSCGAASETKDYVADTRPLRAPPSVSITAPANGATVSGSVTIAGTAAGAGDVALAKVEVQIDNGPLALASGAASWTYSLDATGLAAGSHAVTAKATDIAGHSSSASINVTVGNPPVITSAGSASGTAGSAFSYQITATNNPTSFNATGLPAGLSVNTGGGLISGTPGSAGTFSVTINATNGSGTGSATLTLSIAAAPPPTVSVVNPANGAVVSGTIAISGTANGGVAVSSVGVSVDGGAFAVATGTGAWSFGLNTLSLANGAHTLQAKAWDSAGNVSTSTLVNVTVGNPPAITSAGSASGTAGSAFSYQITATNSATSFNATGLPAGLSVNTASGLISGTPSATGGFSVTLSASNSAGAGTATLALTISGGPTSFGLNGHPFGTGVYPPSAYPQIFQVMRANGLKRMRVSVGLAYDTDPFIAGSLRALVDAAKTYGVQIEPVLQVPFTWGDRTDHGAYPAGDAAALYQQGYNRVLNFVQQFTDIPDWELENEVNLLVTDSGGTPLFGKGMTAAEFNVPLMQDWASVLRGMSDGIDRINATKGTRLRRIVGTTSSMFGYIDFMVGQGVKVDVLGYHYYEHAGVDPTAYWLANGSTFDLFAKLGSYNRPVDVNEVNCAEIYDTAFVNASTSTSMGICNGNLSTILRTFSTQTKADVEWLLVYEMLDEPSKAAPESRFGVMFDLDTPKPLLAALASYAPPSPLAVFVSSPAGGAVLSGSVTISGTVAGNVTISSVGVSVDGAAYTPVSGTSNWASTLDTRSLANGPHTIQAQAWHSSSNASTSSVISVTVNNPPPAITSAGSASGTIGSAFSYQITATNSPTSFNATGLPAGLSVNTSGGLISGTPGSAGTFSVTISATNGSGTGSATLTLSIAAPPPTVSVVNPANGAVVSGTIAISGTASDAGGLSSVAVSVDSGAYSLAVGTTSWIYFLDTALLANGSHQLNARATSLSGVSSVSSVTVSIGNSGLPAPSRQVNYYSVNDGSRFSRSLAPMSAVSAGGTVSQTVNSDGSITAAIAGVSGYADSGFYLRVGKLGDLSKVRIRSSTGVFSLNLWLDRDDDSEFFTWSGDTMAGLGQDAYLLGPSAQNGLLTVDDATLFTSLRPGGGNFTLAQLKAGAAPSVSTATKAAIWVGVAATAVNVSATVDCLSVNGSSDACGLPPPAGLPGAAPVITSAVSASGTVGSAFSYQISASNSPTSYNATGLPAGLSVNTVNGLLSGTPSVAGSFGVGVSATNSAGTGSAALTLTISSAPSSTPPSVTLTSPADGATVSATVSIDADVSTSVVSVAFFVDGSSQGVVAAAPYSFSWDSTQVPDGSHVLTAVASDAAGNGATSAAVTVNVSNTAGTLSVVGDPSASGVVPSAVGQSYDLAHLMGQVLIALKVSAPNFPRKLASLQLQLPAPSGVKGVALQQSPGDPWLYSARVAGSLFSAQDFTALATSSFSITIGTRTFTIRGQPGRIEPSLGGVVVESMGGGASVIVPADGVTHSAQITINALPPDVNGRRATAMTRQNLRSLGAGRDIVMVSSGVLKGATLTLPIDPSLLPKGVTMAQARIAYFNATGAWEIQQNVRVVGNALQTDVSHFSPYQPVVLMPSSVAGLRDSYAYPNPAVGGQEPTIRASLGLVDSVEITIFDVAGKQIFSDSMSGAAAGVTSAGDYYYDYAWTGHKASGVYYAVIHGKKSDGTIVRARTKFIVVR